MRFSTHIKFHCQFLCRFPWKRSFLDILPQKYAEYQVKQECGPWLGYVTDKSSYSFLSQKRWRDQWMQEQDRVRRGKLWLAENVHVTCILASDWSIEAGAGQSRAGEALKVLLVVALLRNIGGQRRFRYKNNLPGFEGQLVPGLEHTQLTDCSSTSSRRWQDKEILFILTNFFTERGLDNFRCYSNIEVFDL